MGYRRKLFNDKTVIAAAAAPATVVAAGITATNKQNGHGISVPVFGRISPCKLTQKPS